MAKLHKYRTAAHGGLFIALLLLINGALPLAWPWYLVLPILVYGGIVVANGPLRRTTPALAVGRLDGRPFLAACVLVLLSMSVLIGFQTIARPDLRSLATRIPIDWIGNLILAGICFSVINALAEEVIFRGILWDVIADEWNEWTSLVLTSVLFGVVHFDGYPPGLIGAVLAGLYGVALGGLRWWVGGLGLPTACHVFADATIFGILMGEEAFEGR